MNTMKREVSKNALVIVVRNASVGGRVCGLVNTSAACVRNFYSRRNGSKGSVCSKRCDECNRTANNVFYFDHNFVRFINEKYIANV